MSKLGGAVDCLHPSAAFTVVSSTHSFLLELKYWDICILGIYKLSCLCVIKKKESWFLGGGAQVNLISDPLDPMSKCVMSPAIGFTFSFWEATRGDSISL